jgi:lipopolysaccharide/colanic/teichoic acid biosynthesis glycosyltransferase
MIGATKLPNSSYASSIDEAQILVRRCAEPRPAGDQVKAAVRRASQRLGIPFSRVRDIWYGDARRIDADEMDMLRQEADKAELAQAVAAIEFLRNKVLTSPSSAAQQLITSLPLLVIVAIAIKLDSPGPALFRQRRRGFNGTCFQIYKFRTMSVLEDGPKITQAQYSDSRITRLGKWLRRTSIDELPQLVNVLEGSMSLVGPRPHALAHDTQFDKIVRNYAFRHRVKPGLTGWAQVNGCRGPTPTRKHIERRVQHDLWYIDNWSFALDLSIMLRTIVEVMRSRNAY